MTQFARHRHRRRTTCALLAVIAVLVLPALVACGDFGLLNIAVRVNVPGEGPRAQGKLVRWHKVSTGEFAIEIQGGHRMVNWQLEGHVMRGSDESADSMALFVRSVYDAIDGPAFITTVPGVGDGAGAAPARRRGKTVLRLPAPKGPEA